MAGAFSDKFKNDKDTVLFYVRTKYEHEFISIPNSVLTNIYSLDFAEQMKKLNKEKAITFVKDYSSNIFSHKSILFENLSLLL